jgi:hypothetical protein
MVLKSLLCQEILEPPCEPSQYPYFSDMPLIFDKKEARTLYHTLFNVAADKFQEAPLLKAALYLRHIHDLNHSYGKHFDIARECIEWIEKTFSNNETARFRTVAWKTDTGTIVPYRLLTITHPLIKAGFEISLLDPDEVNDAHRKYEAFVPLKDACVFKLFGYDFPEIMSQTKAARLLKKILRNGNQSQNVVKRTWR